MTQKDKYIIKRSFRLTEQEAKELSEQAAHFGIPISDYIRKRILGKRITEKAIKVNDMKLIAELNRQGGLLKKFLVDTKGTIDEENRQIASNTLKKIRCIAIKISEYYEERLK